MELLEKLKEYGVDVDAAVARFVGKKDLYTKFLLKFLDDTSYNGLAESIENQKYPEAFEYAHSLKGVCGNLNLSPLTEQVTEMTEILRNKDTCPVRNSRGSRRSCRLWRKAMRRSSRY